MHIPLLADILIILALAVAVVLVFSRLRLPSVVGLLLTGVLAGPHGFGAVQDVESVNVLAEIGVILLLFTIGLEFSLKDLARIRAAALGGGSMQVMFTIALCAGLGAAFGIDLRIGVFAGFLAALSSTAIVLKVLQDRAETDSPHGRTVLGVLIFQDIAVVPMMLLVPVLAGNGGSATTAALPLLLAKAAALVAGVFVAARYVVPRLLYQIARTRLGELFLITVVLLCFAVAWVTAQLGLSLALGAFLAGLIIAESDYSHHALASVLPFKDVFTSFFFVSIGMLFDPAILLTHATAVFALATGVIVLKTATAGGAAALIRMPLRTSLLAGTALAQIGEFSFVLASIGRANGLLDGSTYQMFLAVSILTLAATPPLIASAPRLAALFTRTRESGAEGAESRGLRDHLVIIGYGVNGRNLARAAKSAGITYVITEMNARTVRDESAHGESIIFGDASRDAVLLHAGITRARVAAVAISDAAATRRIVERVRALNPDAHIIARTRFTQEVPPLFALGADEVIPEEFETSVEIFTRVLRRYDVPEKQIDSLTDDVRADGYEMLRRPARHTDAQS